MISINLSFSLLICSSVSPSLVLSPSSVFSFQLLCSPALFDSSISSNSFLTFHYFPPFFSQLLTIFPHSSPKFFVYLYDLYLELFIGWIAFFHLTSWVLSCSFIWNLFLCSLICGLICFYFYVSGWLVAFPDFGEVAFCRRHPGHPSSALPSGYQSCVL